MTKRTAEKFMMKMVGENDIEALLKRLDRLTQEEGVAAGAQILEDVHHLVEHTRVAIDGKKPSNMFFDRFKVFPTLDRGERDSESTGMVRGGPSEFILREYGVYLTLY
jgi:hypothetical protein